jgi:hypothetical protein
MHMDSLGLRQSATHMTHNQWAILLKKMVGSGWFSTGSTPGTTVVFNCTGRGLQLTVDETVCVGLVHIICIHRIKSLSKDTRAQTVPFCFHFSPRGMPRITSPSARRRLAYASISWPPIQDIHATSLLYRTAVKRTTPVLHYQTGYQLVYIGIQ